MVTRRIGGAVAPTFRSPLVAALLLSVSVCAQDPQPASSPQPAGAPPQSQPAAPAAESAPQNAAPVYGKVLGERVQLRCWPAEVASPPMFEDVLLKDQIVRLGAAEEGFRSVVLPLGPIGYVSKRFTEQADDGTVTTTGSRVAFRYRPRTSEAPVEQLPKGTRVHVIAEQEDWYQVRAAGVKAWISNGDVEVVSSDPEHVAAYEAFIAETNKAPQARLDAIVAAAKQRELDRIDMEAVKVVEAAFLKEMQKPDPEQRFDGLVKALTKVESGLQEKGAARSAASALRKRIETQKLVQEAVALIEETPPEIELPPRTEQPKDRLERFEAIGWLRYRSRLGEPGYYYLEKGGRRQFLLSCNTGRFDLALFVGREVGVIGPRRSPLGATLSTLDVERLEVLGSSR